MGEEFYAAIKLVTGEEIFSLICVDDNDGDPVTNHIGKYVKVKPWMEVPTDDFFIVKYDKIVTMTEVKESQMITFYERYINDEDVDIELDGKVQISNKMGYISSVEDARKTLESIFRKDLKDNKES
jgi:hypothetical protein